MVQMTVLEVIARTLKIDAGKLQRETTLGDLGLDSLQVIALLYAMEDEFEIEIPNEDIAKLETVGDIPDLVSTLRNWKD